jgi:nucleotidyltransferase/DNA polymerase involved in DNA repair
MERSGYKAELEALTRRRLDVRGQLWVLAAGHPSKDVREHAIDAAQALRDSLAASSGLVQSMHETLDEDTVTQARELAEQWHRTAADRLERLLEAIQSG